MSFAKSAQNVSYKKPLNSLAKLSALSAPSSSIKYRQSSIQKYIVEVSLAKEIVIRCYKRFNEFEALHQLISMKYKNYYMGELPSKFQVFNKEQTRKKYFQSMLTQIIKDHSHVDQFHETSKRLLSIIYLFLTSDIEPPKEKKKIVVEDSFSEEDFKH